MNILPLLVHWCLKMRVWFGIESVVERQKKAVSESLLESSLALAHVL